MELIIAALGSAALVLWVAVWLALAVVMIASENSRRVRELKPMPVRAKAGA